MPRPKTIYPLKGVFTKLLDDTEKGSFLIPTYQRGYKWTSSGDNNQVEVLMNDLFSAFERGNNKYYLQFITLKDNQNQLEVIDGQQRLTTLTILFCVLFSHEEIRSETNFVIDKLNYQIRENFVKTFIYKNIDPIIDSEDWSDFLKNNAHDKEEVDNQDVYFIYHATNAIHKFITEKKATNSLERFYKYLCDKVFLIINLLDNEMKSEKIFINVNKGVKLKDEDLVKGLLITKIPLDNKELNHHITEYEINQTRANLGRQWDELAYWASRKDIKRFFKIDSEESNGLEWLIRLSYPKVKKEKSTNPLFSYLDKLYKSKEYSAFQIFARLRKTMLILNDWYNEAEIRNLLGYALHGKGSKGIDTIWNRLINQTTKAGILNELKAICLDSLPIDNEKQTLQELNYHDSNYELFNLFLILDVAKFLPIGSRKSSPYDFNKITSQNWSIEHIFPQNSREFKDITSLKEEDLIILKDMLPDNLKGIEVEDGSDVKALSSLLKKIKSADKDCPISHEEKGLLDILLDKTARNLHQLGNLALLQSEMNAGLSNHFFDQKRKKLVRKVSEGEFVPFHTYDVFSKLIINTSSSLHVWTNDDINAHEEYINKEVEAIVNYLNSKA